MIHAYFQKEQGPEGVDGVSLRRVQGLDEWRDESLDKAKEAGSLEWRDRILDAYHQYQIEETDFFLPQVDWWISKAAYDADATGFDGLRKERIEYLYDMEMHEDADEAIKTWRAEQDVKVARVFLPPSLQPGKVGYIIMSGDSYLTDENSLGWDFDRTLARELNFADALRMVFDICKTVQYLPPEGLTIRPFRR